MPYQPIQSYCLIGHPRTAALLGTDGQRRGDLAVVHAQPDRRLRRCRTQSAASHSGSSLHEVGLHATLAGVI